jgi:hypothetical protein
MARGVTATTVAAIVTAADAASVMAGTVVTVATVIPVVAMGVVTEPAAIVEIAASAASAVDATDRATAAIEMRPNESTALASKVRATPAQEIKRRGIRSAKPRGRRSASATVSARVSNVASVRRQPPLQVALRQRKAKAHRQKMRITPARQPMARIAASVAADAAGAAVVAVAVATATQPRWAVSQALRTRARCARRRPKRGRFMFERHTKQPRALTNRAMSEALSTRLLRAQTFRRRQRRSHMSYGRRRRTLLRATRAGMMAAERIG